MTEDCQGHQGVCYYPANDYYELMCVVCLLHKVYNFCTVHGTVMQPDHMFTLSCDHEGGGLLVWSGLINVEV